MNKVLLIGGSSFVGAKIAKYLKLHNYVLISPPSKLLDITKIDSIKKYSENSDFVINLAAYTDVKTATLDKNDLAWKVNVEGAQNVAKACKETGKYLIHVSTDAVFPFNKSGPHAEREKIANYPKFDNPYGYTKFCGETKIKKSGAKAAIIRISYPFGNQNFPNKDYVMKITKLIKQGYPLYADQYLTMTYLKTLPEVIERLIQLQLTGTFHWVCKGPATPYKIGVFINKKLGLKKRIKKDYLFKNGRQIGKHFYSKHGGLTTFITEKQIKLEPPTWETAIEDFLPILENNL